MFVTFKAKQMQYYPVNLVSVEYVLATLENFKGQPAEVQTAVRNESIQKLGELAATIAKDMERLVDRYQLIVDRQKLTATIAGITAAVSSAVPVPIVQGLGVLVGLAGSLISGVQGKNAAKALAEVQTLQLRIDSVQAAIKGIQDSSTSSSSTLVYIVAAIAAFFFIGQKL